MSTSIDLATPGSANPRGRQSIGTHRRTTAADTLQAAWDAGCYKAMLQTGSRAPATHAFYRACGFSPDAKTAYLARPS